MRFAYYSKYRYYRRPNSIKKNMENEIKEIVCDFESLYKAMRVCKQNVIWKDSVAGFVKNGLANCYKLRQQVLNGTYKIDDYTIFRVYEPKEREIVSTRFKDRVFQRSLCDNYLYDELTKTFVYDNCACQKNKGTDFARNRLECHMQKHFRKHGLNGFILKCDISNYFGSTPHDVAISAVAKRVDDEWALSEVTRIIKSFSQGVDPDVGMGLGSQVTQLIELAVLDDLDHYIKEKLHIKHYIRYMDDFILIHDDKEYLRQCRALIESRLQSYGLKLSVKKTQLQPVGQPVHFLGFSYQLTGTGKVIKRILPERISHERRKLRKLANLVNQGVLTKEHVFECYKSWRAHASKGDNHKVILEMDKFYKNLWRYSDETSNTQRTVEN